MPYSMLPQYLDSYDLPGSISSDNPLNMGDACADYFTILATTDMPDSNINLFWSPENTPRRHPDTTQWWGQPHAESRDQFIPILAYAIMRNANNSFISNVFWSHLKRLFLFAWNTRSTTAPYTAFNFPDITFLDQWGLWLRVYRPFGYQLLTPFCDLYTLFSAIQWKYFPPNNISRNFLLTLLAENKYPTFVSKLALKISNVPNLVTMWNTNTQACGEYPTGPLIESALQKVK